MRNHFGLLDTDVMPMFMIIALDTVITMCSFTNCSVVIRSPTVIFAILREATSEAYGPRVYLPSYYFPINLLFLPFLFCNLYFPIYIIKIPKIFILLSLSDLTFASGRKGLTTPLSCWLQGSYLFVQVQGDLRVTSYWIDTLVLKN